MKGSSVAIIILNWNGYQVTKECLQSLFQIDHSEYRVFLVDNGSHDGSVKQLTADFSSEDRFVLLPLDQNQGFTGGNNHGIAVAIQTYHPDYVLLLNNDTVVEVDFLTKMLDSIHDQREFYAAVPKIMFYDRPDEIWFAGGKISRLTGIVTHFGLNKKDSHLFDKSGPTYFMNGCCALIKSEAINEIGVLDHQFFANSEDADYSLRLLKAGHSIKYVSEAKIYHKVSHSFKSNKGRWFTFYMATRNIILLQRKHLSPRLLLVFFFAFSVRWMAYLTVKLMMLRDVKSVKGIYLGFMDGFFDRHEIRTSLNTK